MALMTTISTSAIWSPAVPSYYSPIYDLTRVIGCEYGTTGNDDKNYMGHNDRLVYDGRGGLDDIWGGNANDVLYASGTGFNGWRVGDSRGPTPGVNATNLDGGAGNDTFYVTTGATGSVMLIGGAGDDIFHVHGGTNVLLSGDDGRDTFEFNSMFSGHAEIRSFQRGLDNLSLSSDWMLDPVAAGHGGDWATFSNGHGGHFIVDGTSHDLMASLNHGNGQWY
jgi:hypothetical protein